MTFNQLHENIECNCVVNSAENTSNHFARNVSKTTKVKATDFRSHHERGKIQTDNSCKTVCSYRGVSIDIWNEESKKKISDRLNRSHEISPGVKKVLLIFKLKKDAGQIEFSPTSDNPFHYDLYKADGFDSQSHIEFIEVLKPETSK
jgi:hypothetical protein